MTNKEKAKVLEIVKDAFDYHVSAESEDYCSSWIDGREDMLAEVEKKLNEI